MFSHWHAYNTPSKHHTKNHPTTSASLHHPCKLQFTNLHTIEVLPTPPNTNVNKSTKWNNTPYSTSPLLNSNMVPPLPTYDEATQLKFPQQYKYYTDRSFFLPSQIIFEYWRAKTTSSGIFNPHKKLCISERLSRLQNILRAELMAIHQTLKMSNIDYANEPFHIFTNSLNSIYLLLTQISHPTLHNNHLDKTILAKMVKMLQQRIQPTTIT